MQGPLGAYAHERAGTDSEPAQRPGDLIRPANELAVCERLLPDAQRDLIRGQPGLSRDPLVYARVALIVRGGVVPPVEDRLGFIRGEQRERADLAGGRVEHGAEELLKMMGQARDRGFVEDRGVILQVDRGLAVGLAHGDLEVEASKTTPQGIGTQPEHTGHRCLLAVLGPQKAAAEDAELPRAQPVEHDINER